MLKTFAVLQSLKNNNISLDSPIYSYLYSDWQSLAGVGIAPNLLGPQVTFRDFLTHRSGWAADNNGGGCGGPSTSYAILKAKIQLTTTPQPQGSNAQAGQYTNCNFAIFRELLPQMEGTNINSIADDNKRALASAQFYNEYVNTNVRIAAGIPGMWSCTPVSEPSTAINYQILSYPTRNGPGSTPPICSSSLGDSIRQLGRLLSPLRCRGVEPQCKRYRSAVQLSRPGIDARPTGRIVQQK
jgi:hypothetical protein